MSLPDKSSNIRKSLAVIFLLFCASLAFADDLKRQGSLGVKVSVVPNIVKNQLHLTNEQGVLVEAVSPHSSAQVGGIEADDIILKVNGVSITGVEQFVLLVRGLRGGDRVTVELQRAAQRLTKSFTLKPRPLETNADFDIFYKAVSVENAGRRRVIVTAPRSPGKHPALLFLTGIGCGSQDNLPPDNALAKILYDLTRKGFVTMRVEKSGVGDSEGAPCSSPQVDLQAEVSGYVAGLKALKNYDFVDSDNVFIFGLSIGGIVAPLVVREIPVKGLIVAETIGTSWYEYELENLRRQLLLRDRSYDEVERLVSQKNYCNQRLYIQKQTPGQIAKDAPFCARLPIQSPAPYTYMQQVADLNLAEAWKPVDAPVLVIYGTSDFLTSREEHQYLTNMINSFHPDRATFSPIEKMDHFLAQASSQRDSLERTENAQAEDVFEPAILERMKQWLNDILKQEIRN